RSVPCLMPRMAKIGANAGDATLTPWVMVSIPSSRLGPPDTITSRNWIDSVRLAPPPLLGREIWRTRSIQFLPQVYRKIVQLGRPKALLTSYPLDREHMGMV